MSQFKQRDAFGGPKPLALRRFMNHSRSYFGRLPGGASEPAPDHGQKDAGLLPDFNEDIEEPLKRCC